MNDELPHPFSEVTPRQAPHSLRTRVLAAVDEALSATESCTSGFSAPLGATAGLSSSAVPCPAAAVGPTRHVSFEKLSALAVAAGLLVGIGLQAWQWRLEKRIEALYVDKPMPRALADVVRAVESVTDKETARRFAEQLTAMNATPSVREKKFDDDHSFYWQGLTTYQSRSIP
jgi:hypothetical protein